MALLVDAVRLVLVRLDSQLLHLASAAQIPTLSLPLIENEKPQIATTVQSVKFGIVKIRFAVYSTPERRRFKASTQEPRECRVKIQSMEMCGYIFNEMPYKEAD